MSPHASISPTDYSSDNSGVLAEDTWVRRARADDAFVLAQIGAQTFSETHDKWTDARDVEGYIASNFTPVKILQEMHDQNPSFWLGGIGKDPAVLGYAKLRPAVPPVCVEGDALELQRIYVRQAVVGQGLGGALLRTCIRHAIRAGWSGMWLGVDRRNHDAIGFYRRFGFDLVGTKDYTIGTIEKPNLILWRSLTWACRP